MVFFNHQPHCPPRDLNVRQKYDPIAKITALLFILIGITAIYTTITDLKSGTLPLNVFIFCLVVGIGLLRNRNSSKRWGRLWTWVFFVFMLFLSAR